MTWILIVAILIFGIGIYTLLSQKNLLKLAIALNLMETALVLLIVVLGYRPGGGPPILLKEDLGPVDPLPQAMALTTIVIGTGTLALTLGFVVKLYEHYGTLDIDEIRRLKG